MSEAHIQIMQDLSPIWAQESEQEVEDLTGGGWEPGTPPKFWWEYMDDADDEQYRSPVFNSCDACCADIQKAEEDGRIPAKLPILRTTDCGCERKAG